MLAYPRRRWTGLDHLHCWRSHQSKCPKSSIQLLFASTGYYWPFQLLLIVQTLIGQRSFALPTVWNSLASALNDSNLFLQVCAAAKIIFSDSGDHHPAALWRIAILRLQMFRVSHFLSFFLSFLWHDREVIQLALKNTGIASLVNRRRSVVIENKTKRT